MVWFRMCIALLVVAMMAAACSGDGGDDTSIPTSGSGATATLDTLTPPVLTETTVTSVGMSTSTTEPATTTVPGSATLPPYSIEARRTAAAGDTVLVLVPPGSYSDLDLEDIMRDVVERFAPIATAHVVDSLDFDADGLDDPAASVLTVVGAEAAVTPDEALFRADHYFVRLEEGFRMVFQGPFQANPPIILGS
jgi:hypothetical protein